MAKRYNVELITHRPNVNNDRVSADFQLYPVINKIITV